MATWTDKLVISRETALYSVWDVAFTFSSVISAILALYYTAAQINFTWNQVFSDYKREFMHIRLFVGLELAFCIQIVLNFFTEYRNPLTNKTERRLPKIAWNYFTSNFIMELISVIPWN